MARLKDGGEEYGSEQKEIVHLDCDWTSSVCLLTVLYLFDVDTWVSLYIQLFAA